MPLRAVDVNRTCWQVANEMAEGVFVGSGRIENGKGTVVPMRGDGGGFLKFCREVHHRLDGARQFMGQQPTPNRHGAMDFAAGRFPRDEADQMPNQKCVNVEWQECQPTPHWQGAIRPFAKDGCFSLSIGDAHDHKTHSQPDQPPVLPRHAISQQSSSQQAIEQCVFHLEPKQLPQRRMPQVWLLSWVSADARKRVTLS